MRTRGGQIIPKFYGRHIWMAPIVMKAFQTDFSRNILNHSIIKRQISNRTTEISVKIEK